MSCQEELTTAYKVSTQPGKTNSERCPFEPIEIMTNCSRIDPASPYLHPQATNCADGVTNSGSCSACAHTHSEHLRGGGG
jgi:hypothetical protein